MFHLCSVHRVCVCVCGLARVHCARPVCVRVLFIGTQFNGLYTPVDTPAGAA
jgi:hypothetical protein